MRLEDMLYREFERNLREIIPHGKNIILYGGRNGGDYVRWFCEKNGETVKAWLDRWELSNRGTIPHLWSLAYLYEDNDVIINCSNMDIVEEYNDTGEMFEKTGYTRNDIVELWSSLYGVSGCEKYIGGGIQRSRIMIGWKKDMV